MVVQGFLVSAIFISILRGWASKIGTCWPLIVPTVHTHFAVFKDDQTKSMHVGFLQGKFHYCTDESKDNQDDCQ